MPLAFGLVLLGAALLYSGFQGHSLVFLLTGKEAPGEPPPGSAPSAGGGAAGGLTAPPAGPTIGGNAHTVLVQLTHLAHSLGLRVNDFGPGVGKKFPESDSAVFPVHVPGSLHYKGQAFDAAGSTAAMEKFAHEVAHRVPNVGQLYWCGPGAINLTQGKPASCGGGTGGHKDHVHVGMY